MQVLKDDIRRRILDAARSQFTNHGFANTLMKDIASDAEMTVGNLYRYFSGKDDLFVAVVTPAIAAIDDLIASIKPPESEKTSDFNQFQQTIVERVLHLFLHHKTELQILLNGSTNSSLENMRHHVVEALSQKIKHHVLELFPFASKNNELMIFFELLAHAYIGSIEDILLHIGPQQNPEKTRLLLRAIGELYFRNLGELIIKLSVI